MAGEEQALFARLLSSLPPQRSVLEVGCGTGHFTRWWAAQGLSATGVDVAPGMLTVARELDPAGRYARAAAEVLPFAARSFDLVTFNTALEFVDRPAAALREAARVARHALLLGVLNLASPLGLQRRLEARLQPSSPFGAADFPTPWRLERLARRALGPRVQRIHWETAIWPRRLPTWARVRPFGAFIGMLIVLHQPEER